MNLQITKCLIKTTHIDPEHIDSDGYNYLKNTLMCKCNTNLEITRFIFLNTNCELREFTMLIAYFIHRLDYFSDNYLIFNKLFDKYDHDGAIREK